VLSKLEGNTEKKKFRGNEIERKTEDKKRGDK
jgi:hypothetical protein